ncbi:MAG: hypothetical protein RMI01_09580 [Thermodesulfovibrio sp.]|nr:hypothetical protein [Thermodesulfovibrio sp.]
MKTLISKKVVMQMFEADKAVYIKDAEDSVLLFCEHILMPVRL